jgi:hypothetical protein
MSAYVKSEKSRDRCNPIWGNAFLYWLNLAKASKFHQNPIKYRFILAESHSADPGAKIQFILFNLHPEAAVVKIMLRNSSQNLTKREIGLHVRFADLEK